MSNPQFLTLSPPAHGGNLIALAQKVGCKPEEILDFSVNLNPFGPPSWLRDRLIYYLDDIIPYPPPYAEPVREAISRLLHLSENHLLLFNGANQLIHLVPHVFKPKRAILFPPAYLDYYHSMRLAEVPIVEIPRKYQMHTLTIDFTQANAILTPGDFVWIDLPNNPSGNIPDLTTLRTLICSHPEVIFGLDISFYMFVDDFPIHDWLFLNVLIVESLTKFFAIAGLRLGILYATPELIARVFPYVPAWSVNILAQHITYECLADRKYIQNSRKQLAKVRKKLINALQELPCEVFDAPANYVLLKFASPEIVEKLQQRLLKEYRIAIRSCENYPNLDGSFVRVAVRNAEDNQYFVTALQNVLFHPKGKGKTRKIPFSCPPALMIQGTSSHVGKSVLTAGLCRCFLRRGIRVVPFKAQNMSNNSYVTLDGKEIARAQALQAIACRLEPKAEMSPILLKPHSEMGAQVIVMGKPVGHMKVQEYYAFRPKAWKIIQQAYRTLSQEADLVLIEGAGSPAEINLKPHDIVNMSVAKLANAQVALVGDIDKGGVFAALVGTLELLTSEERQRILGFIINKFRGDATLLKSAYDFIQQRTGKPVLGTVPWIEHLHLPEEDSVSLPSYYQQGIQDPSIPPLKVGVIQFPHISNFTDLDALRLEPDILLVPITHGSQLDETYHLIILPGSKHTIADLQYINKHGIAEKLKELATNQKTEILGICGGFQMLGETIQDPYAIENLPSENSSYPGLGILPIHTILMEEKVLRRKKAFHQYYQIFLDGYEIHHGITRGENLIPLAVDPETQKPLILAHPSLPIWGTYLHGLFDDDTFRHCYLNGLRQRLNLPPYPLPRPTLNINHALDQFADLLEQHLSIDKLLKSLLRRGSQS